MRRAAALLAAALVLTAGAQLPAPAAAAAATTVDIAAPNALLLDVDTGDVLFERGADQQRPIASTTKLMTALLVLERSKLADVAPAARYRALPAESKLGLRPTDRLTVADLMRGMLVYSANDAAVTLAEHVSGSVPAFVREMNLRAKQLGLAGAHFANPVGLDAAGNHASARDLAKLALELRKFAFFRKVVDLPSVTLTFGGATHTYPSRNKLVRKTAWIDGVKTGHTIGAGYVLVASGTKRGVSLLSVVLGTPSEAARDVDSLKLLRYGYSQFPSLVALRRGQVLPGARVPIRYRAGAKLDLMASRTVRRRARRGSRFELKLLGVPAEVDGPIREGQRFGTIEIYLKGQRISRVPLVASSGVPEAAAARRAKDFFTRPSTIGLLAGLLLLAAGLSALRRRWTEKSRRSAEGVPTA